MYFLLLILASVGPGLLWLWYFYRLDRFEPEPLRLIFRVFFAGMLLVIPAGLLEQIWRGQLISAIAHGNWISLLTMAFLVISLIEEGLKTGFLWWLVGRNKELNEPVDGIIYGITLGLGFASLENFLWSSVFGFKVAALRAVITTLAHANFSGWVGFYVAKNKLTQQSNRWMIIVGFLVAFISHGLYDFLLFLGSPLSAFLAFALIAVMLFRLYQNLQQQVINSPFRK